MRRIAADPDNITRPSFWNDRLDEQYRRGLSPVEAIRAWIGVPEDPHMGGVPADAHEHDADSMQQLWAQLNPGDEPLGEGPWVQDDEFPSGTPLDRSKGWSVPHIVQVPSYATDTTTPVHYYPVYRNRDVIGYLWAAAAEPAADYLPQDNFGPDGYSGRGLWIARLQDAYASGRTALEAIRWCASLPYDEYSGVIGPGVAEQYAESLADLRDIAGQ
ncbi:hypothetical protein [Nocardia pseudovaccinii]|uniref:hypothetical protein n=1 Tax=Nocardia pseudovaccinii TaxID=189540 RepID=UPI0007A4F5A6|nr:hypothetical protein [Nocardia pseudovaccinii]